MAPTDAPLLSKLIVVPGLVVSTAVTVILLMESGHDSAALYTFVTQHPTQTQVLIQIAAHLLGFIHIFTLSTITNFSTRLRLQQGSVSLTQLRLWQSISSIKFVWNLPYLHTGILLSYIFLHLLPASVWAAALTPILLQSTTLGKLRIPSYPPDPTGQSWNRTEAGPVTRNEKGVFSYDPALILHGPIFNSASTAASFNGVRVHAKNDNTQLSYVQRSYGVGASAGLEDLVLDRGDQQTSLLYTYQELGYVTNVTCSKNQSSAYGVHPWDKGSSPAFPDAYLACGVLPNSLYQPGTFFSDSGCPGLIPGYFAEWYAVLAGGGNASEDHVLALQGVSHSSRNMFAIATGSGQYSVLDKVQCEAHFVPQIFQVSVNTTSSHIRVTPLGNSTEDMDPSATTYGPGAGRIPTFIVGEVTSLCGGGTPLYNSAMGDSFISNIKNVAMARNGSVNDTSIIFEGVSTALESMIDDLLLALGSAQIEIAWKDAGIAAATSAAITTVTVPAMRLGTFQYVVIIAALNFLIVAMYCMEFARTRAWRGLPLFDYNDIASVVVAVSRGGQQVGTVVASLHKENGTVWAGDAGTMEGAKTRISLRFDDGMPTIRAVDPSDEDDQKQFLKTDYDDAQRSVWWEVQV